MKTTTLAALVLVPTLLLQGCVTYTTRTRTWGASHGEDDRYGQRWERYGRVEQVRETAVRQQGDPAGGAVAGAIIGGVLGHAIFGRGGGFAGAVGGAAVGASASQGAAEDRYYEVLVRFDDGGQETFMFQGALPFRPGDEVRLTPRGLQRM
jgi:outer membrane lipoprotein SlyB